MKTNHAQYRTWGRSRGNRLDPALYPPGQPAHVIVGTHLRKPVFEDPSIARAVFSLLEEDDQTLAVCLMPDHLHWVLRDAKNMSTVVGRFKSLSTHKVWRTGDLSRDQKLWQRSFWDHVIRADEDLEQTIDYILANPVRAGLVASAQEYPWRVVRWRNPEV